MPSASPVYETLTSRNQLRLQELGERFRLARQRRQWTQKDLAAKAGISEGTLKKIEAGNPRVPVGFWLQLMDVFGIADEIELLALPENDRVGAAMDDRPIRQRVRSRTAPIEFDLGDD
jgi:transcriptional regulator with XRE-family HTH domain